MDIKPIDKNLTVKIPFIDLNTQYTNHKSKFDEAILHVLKHGQYIMGPEVHRLEEQLADYLEVKHALACSSGTDALILPLMQQKLVPTRCYFYNPIHVFCLCRVNHIGRGYTCFCRHRPADLQHGSRRT